MIVLKNKELEKNEAILYHTVVESEKTDSF
jgi:hypothetical protein